MVVFASYQMCHKWVLVVRVVCGVTVRTILLQNAYLPTMPEDTLPEAKRVLGGKFYGKYFFLVT